jgi:DNA polymerase III subunit delta
MPAHTLDALSRSIHQGHLAPAYYFHGPEDVLKDEAVRAILDQALDPGLRDFNLDQRSATQLDGEELQTLCNTLPMLAERRVVVLRDVEAWKRKTRGRTEFLRYLEHPGAGTLVILVQGSGDESEDKELARATYSVRFSPLSPERAYKWVLRRAGQLGLNLEPSAAEHLVRSVGTELGPLASEVAKLASLPADEPITAERLGHLVGVRHGETLWDWRRAVLDGRTGQAVGLLSAILAQPGVSGVKLVTLLATALLGVALTRTYYDRGSRGRALEDAVFKALMRSRPAGLLGYREEAAAWSQWAPQWPATRSRLALRAALETDQALKSTTVSDERGLLADLVLRISISAEVAA